MSIVYLSMNDETNKIKGEAVWNGFETLNTPGAGNTFLLPDKIGKIEWWMVQLIMNTIEGKAKIQLSISEREDLKAGLGNFFDWEDGEVFNDTRRSYPQISAMRMVNISGTTTLEMKVI